MSVTMRVEGLRDIEKALAKLPAVTAKGVARRAMKKELAPVAQMANALWPGDNNDVFKITSKLTRSQKRHAQSAGFSRSITNVYVGANASRYGGTPHAHLIEFGTGPRFTKRGAFRGSVAPQPMLQPAWDMHKRQILAGLGARMWDEITKTMARRAARAARQA